MAANVIGMKLGTGRYKDKGTKRGKIERFKKDRCIRAQSAERSQRGSPWVRKIPD